MSRAWKLLRICCCTPTGGCLHTRAGEGEKGLFTGPGSELTSREGRGGNKKSEDNRWDWAKITKNAPDLRFSPPTFLRVSDYVLVGFVP